MLVARYGSQEERRATVWPDLIEAIGWCQVDRQAEALESGRAEKEAREADLAEARRQLEADRSRAAATDAEVAELRHARSSTEAEAAEAKSARAAAEAEAAQSRAELQVRAAPLASTVLRATHAASVGST